jgi:predicted alpha/beta superfamily hydrolase
MKSICFILLTTILLLANNSNASQTNDSVPVHETFRMESKQMGETRIINVWVPEEYSKNSDALPVMYMADGGIEEDFSHIAMTFSKLIKSKQIPPFILVGIENTQRRRDLTGPTEVKKDKTIAPVVGGAEKFRTFISEELIPEINKRYRTSDKKGILGESLSGLFVMETLLLKPEMFDYYIAFDPSLWWNNHYLVKTAKEQLAKFPATKKVVWFAGSDAKDISTYTNQLSKILTAENPSVLEWTYSDEPNEQHSTIFKATKEKALIWTLNKLK